MGLLADVLQSVHQVSVVDVNKRVPMLKQKVDELRKDILIYIDNVYLKQNQALTKNEIFLKHKYPRIEEEIKCLKESAQFAVRKDIRRTITNLENPLETFNQITIDLNTLKNFININSNIFDFDHLLDDQQYVQCKELISHLESDVSEISEDDYAEVNAMVNIINDRKRTLETILNNNFQEHVTFQKCNGSNLYTLKVANNSTSLKQILLASFYDNAKPNILENLKELLWKHFFIPVLHNSNTVEIKIDETYIANILQINIISTQKVTDYKQLFLNLEMLVNFLKDNFCYELNDNLTTLEYIGNSVQDDLLEALFKQCPALRDLETYKTMIVDLEKLERTLKECKIFRENTSLLDLTSNIKILHINKKCQNYISESVAIMRELDTSNCLYIKKLQCSVSCTVVKLLQFCEKILEEAADESEAYAAKLIYTVKSIVTMYGQFVPEYHKSKLQLIPKQMALFYNDCVHIGCVLTAVNERLCHKFPKNCCKFEIEQHQIQIIASRILANSVEDEIKSTDCKISEVQFDIISSVIQSCLQHHEYLKSELIDVLSYTKYTHIMGKILNSFITCNVSRIINAQKLSSDDVEILIDVLKVIREHVEKMFASSEEVSTHVHSWGRLCELNNILGKNLLDIMNRWDDGKGPLSKQYKCDEVKSLVRSIFPHSEDRASVLSKIT